jgi:hypothetical protein
MQHGTYITEFEKILLKHSYAISHNSLSQLVEKVDFSKLRDSTESDRFAFYEALVESISIEPRGAENGIQILGENDSLHIIDAMSDKAKTRSFASSRIRDIWCRIFIGGCP